MKYFTIKDIEAFNVARIFAPAFIPDGMTARYEMEYTTHEGPMQVKGTASYKSRSSALADFDRMTEQDPMCDCSVREIIYAANGEIFADERIADYYY